MFIIVCAVVLLCQDSARTSRPRCLLLCMRYSASARRTFLGSNPSLSHGLALSRDTVGLVAIFSGIPPMQIKALVDIDYATKFDPALRDVNLVGRVGGAYPEGSVNICAYLCATL